MQDFEEFAHATGEHTLPVYRSGQGPGVLIMHELPGMVPECVEFARRVRDGGFTVYLPLFFGKPNQSPAPARHGMELMFCVRREFYMFEKNLTSPMVEKMRSLCRRMHQECGGPGVGAVGMCLTGGFAIPLLLEKEVIAPAVSQPGIPGGMGKDARSSLGLSPEHVQGARKRVRDDNLEIRGYRFSHDPLSPPERFETYGREFGKAFKPCVIDSSWGNDHKIPLWAHSVFTLHYDHTEGHPTRKAFDDLLGFFKAKLLSE